MNKERPRKSKILYIGHVPPEIGGQGSGGPATLCWSMATQTARRGYDVYICTNIASSYSKNGVKLISMSSGNKWIKAIYALLFYIPNRKALKNLDFLTLRQKVNILYKACLLKRIVKSVKPDLIHVIRLLDDSIFSLRAIDKCPPIVVTDNGIGLVYEFNFHKLYGFARNELLLKRIECVLKVVNCVVPVSQFSGFLLLKALGLPDHEKIKVFLNPVNTDKWKLLDREKAKKEIGLGSKKVILFCAVHFPIEIKGLDILLKAIANDDILRKDCDILIITSDEARVFAQDYIKANEIKGLILGPQPQEKLVTCYNAADVFVMPSRIESMGTVYYEALLAGVPLVGFSKNIEEFEEVLGIYVGEKFDAGIDNEKSLAEKIKKVLDMRFDKQLLRTRVLERLSWDARFHKLDSIYQEIISNA
jgi:glycosyltransferase involved in cell wall biosynthesis